MSNSNWPPLDAHAHVDVTITPSELLALRAVVFAASRSLEESRQAINRQPSDLLTVWGLGVHPGLKTALEQFNLDSFKALLNLTPYVGEVGLDGKVKSRLNLQRAVLKDILTELQTSARITSLHSYGATNELVELLESTPIEGAILHWWLGDVAATKKAVELGAYFSINAANLKNREALDHIPLYRILTETDHPDGDRWSAQPRRPGNVTNVEIELARRHGISAADVRRTCWKNLRRLTESTRTQELLPPRVQAILLASQ
jgi:TatD DNase family protein